MMRKWLKPVGVMMLTGTLLLGGPVFGGVFQATPAYADEVQKNVISVVGNGEITVKPDIAYLSIGVETQAKTAKEAQSANAAKFSQISKLLKDTWKIDSKDLKTGQFYVQPNYTYNEKEGQKLTGYTATHTLNVTYRDLEKVGTLIDAVTEAGANRIDNIRFSVENGDQYLAEVIQKAMNNANVKASAIAKAANRQLGAALNISQSGGNVSLYSENYAMKTMAVAADSGTSVEPGEITVSTSLSITYEMK
ncbi:SIMPL domain-containing protein [Paenibacillus aceti]|nr:SIMPL domain-containing protein [Paenibacillus aceti]